MMKEFLSLTQGDITVNEYVSRFTQLSRYAPVEVDTDEKKQEREGASVLRLFVSHSSETSTGRHLLG